MDKNNVGFNCILLFNPALEMFKGQGNACNTFIRPERYTQCLLVINTEFKQKFCMFTRKFYKAPLSQTEVTKMIDLTWTSLLLNQLDLIEISVFITHIVLHNLLFYKTSIKMQ